MAQLTDRERKNIALTFLANFNGTMKWAWQIVMGFALMTAVRSLYEVSFLLFCHFGLFGCKGNAMPTDFTPITPLISIVMFVFVFVPTFVRFFYGDSRYLDQHYIELTLFASYAEGDDFAQELHLMRGKRRFFDILLLIFHGVLFVFMAYALKDPELFILLYAFLMITNLLWLRANVSWNQQKETTTEWRGIKDAPISVIQKEVYVYPARDSAPRFWIKNNLYHFIAFAALMYVYYVAHLFGSELYLSLAIALCVTNSIIDLSQTWFFYFPKLEPLLVQPNTEDDGKTTGKHNGQ